MSNDTTRIFVPDGNNDALTAAALLNNNNGGGAWANNPIWALAFLGIFANGGFGGWGNNGGGRNGCQLSAIQEQLNTIQGNNSLMSAIQGGANEVRALANALNSDVNAVQAAINGVQAAICNVGNQVGMTSSQVINAINSGNMSLANTLQNCCCTIQTDVLKMGYENQINNLQQSNMIQKGFGDIATATQMQTTALAANNDSNTRSVLAKLDAIEDNRKDREINALTAQLTAANSRAERAAELAPILKQLNDIKCAQPNTVTVPYQPFVTIPNCVAYNALYGGYPFAQQGNVFS